MTSHVDFRETQAGKKSTGIEGLDEITGGGLPEIGLTAVTGGPGAGKTVFALQFVFSRLVQHGEPAIVVSCEEPAAQLLRDAASFEWGAGNFSPDQIRIVEARLPIDTIASGSFDLSSLLAGLLAIKNEIGARNIVFDGIDVLLSGLPDSKEERRELSRVNDWVREAELFGILTVKSEGLTERDQEAERLPIVQYTMRGVVECRSRPDLPDAQPEGDQVSRIGIRGRSDAPGHHKDRNPDRLFLGVAPELSRL